MPNCLTSLAAAARSSLRVLLAPWVFSRGGCWPLFCELSPGVLMHAGDRSECSRAVSSGASLSILRTILLNSYSASQGFPVSAAGYSVPVQLPGHLLLCTSRDPVWTSAHLVSLFSLPIVQGDFTVTVAPGGVSWGSVGRLLPSLCRPNGHGARGRGLEGLSISADHTGVTHTAGAGVSSSRQWAQADTGQQWYDHRLRGPRGLKATGASLGRYAGAQGSAGCASVSAAAQGGAAPASPGRCGATCMQRVPTWCRAQLSVSGGCVEVEPLQGGVGDNKVQVAWRWGQGAWWPAPVSGGCMEVGSLQHACVMWCSARSSCQ